MDMKLTGGPAFPTLTGGTVNDTTFRFEGMTLFDYYAAASMAGGNDPEDALMDAEFMIEARLEYLTQPEIKDESASE
jgi:hypothetical protein